MAHRPTLTLALPSFGSAPDGGWRRLLDLALAADDAGVDRVVVSDHVVNGPDVADYPWGRFPTGPEGDWLEPLTVLTALGAVTERVRLATGILIAPLRPAALLAKAVATLDVLSAGRVDLGVGTGWQRAEFDAVGVPYDDRGRSLTDTVGACRALWAHLPATFESATVSFRDTYCAPQPVQSRLPVWFSGTLTDRNVRRIVELGDGWLPIMGTTPDGLADGAAKLRAAFVAAGRDPEELQVQANLPPVKDAGGRPDPVATTAAAAELHALGATSFYVHLRTFDRDLADPARTCRSLVDAFRRSF